MKFRPGDKVRFLNEVGEGTVKFFRDNKVFVETADGFEIPFKESELVPGRDMYNREETNPKRSAAPAPATSGPGSSPSVLPIKPPDNIPFSGYIYLAVVPTNPFSVSVSDYALYLLNDSDWDLMFSVSTVQSRKLNNVAKGTLESGMKFHLETFTQTRISKENIKIQLLFTREGQHPFLAPVVKDVILTEISFYKQKAFSVNDFFDDPAFLEIVADTKDRPAGIKMSLEEMKDRMGEKNLGSQQSQPSVDEENWQVDLHIHELIENSAGLQSHEMLKIQMDTFVKSLEEAILNKKKRVVFIHGIGNGRLKYEIRKKLDTEYTQLKYQDASFQEYGFGATLVFTS